MPVVATSARRRPRARGAASATRPAPTSVPAAPFSTASTCVHPKTATAAAIAQRISAERRSSTRVGPSRRSGRAIRGVRAHDPIFTLGSVVDGPSTGRSLRPCGLPRSEEASAGGRRAAERRAERARVGRERADRPAPVQPEVGLAHEPERDRLEQERGREHRAGAQEGRAVRTAGRQHGRREAEHERRGAEHDDHGGAVAVPRLAQRQRERQARPGEGAQRVDEPERGGEADRDGEDLAGDACGAPRDHARGPAR